MRTDPEKEVVSVLQDYLPLWSKLRKAPPRDKFLRHDLGLSADEYYEAIEEISGRLDIYPAPRPGSREPALLRPPDLTGDQILEIVKSGAWPAEYVIYPPEREDRTPAWLKPLKRWFAALGRPPELPPVDPADIVPAEVVIVNESSDDRPGDVWLERSIADATYGMEVIDVEAGEFRAITATGVRLNVLTDGRRMWMEPDPSAPPEPEVARRLLQTMLRWKHERGRATDVSVDDTNERLVAAIGFER